MEGVSQTTLLLIVLIALLIVGAVAVLAQRRRRSETLRQQFGPEYQRAVQRTGDRTKAEADLQRRQERVKNLSIRRLSDAECDRYATQWRTTQAHFVDNPRAAVEEADRLVDEVMTAAGYPMGEFEQRAADISVDHPRVVEHYRAAHTIALEHQKGHASTEDLRRALVHYRTLFEDLLGRFVTERREVHR